ncbi:MAG TPA: class I SAM-dependent methyltransferase [Gemmatimonadaceae bacterium]|nr:class I SAM-dependent methyltransferase [Gemmatimonadaceae bacterium]
MLSDPSARMLHIAPEACLEPRLKKLLGTNYLTADLSNPRAMVQMDITDIRYPDQSFDIIFCNHVLEHVPDDRKAMREMHRVLSDTGCAILLVPITVDETFEDPSVTDPAERLRLFGQHDHVRRYGPDYVDRLRSAGFTVHVVTAMDLVSEEKAVRLGFTDAAGELFLCTRSSDTTHHPGFSATDDRLREREGQIARAVYTDLHGGEGSTTHPGLARTDRSEAPSTELA